MPADVLLGLQWGDEGKGKIVDVLTQGYDIIARFQGGPNAGHTLEFDGMKHVLHTIPSGIFHKDALNLIGNGVVMDPIVFRREIEALEKFNINLRSRLLISRKTHLILPTHRLLDAASEAAKGKAKIGSTLKGIGPAYMDKTGRNGLRIGDLEQKGWKKKYRALANKHEDLIGFHNSDIAYHLEELEEEFFAAVKVLKGFRFIDSEQFILQQLSSGKAVLAEGAQGSLLDIDFGTYPFVTSSTTTAAGACIGLGLSPKSIGKVMGVFKAYTTRVGGGPFPTELFDTIGDKICEVGREYGSTTGRKRRCGWLDLVALKYAVDLNGVTDLLMMKADVLSNLGNLKVCTSYIYNGEEIRHLPYTLEEDQIKPVYKELQGWNEDLTSIKSPEELPASLMDYIRFIEAYVGVKITLVSVGPDREQTIKMGEHK